ncbi:high-affinity choline transporter 1-like [Amblyomma americanum]
MPVNTVAVAAMATYYVVVAGLAAWYSRRQRVRKCFFPSRGIQDYDEQMGPRLLRLCLANRNIPLSLGFSSMTASWVGGGYLNGTAEAVFKHGLLNAQVPIGYAMSLALGGLFFANKMRSTRSLTMLDPFQQLYGRWMGLLLSVPALCGEIFWAAAVLAALGQTAKVIVGLNGTECIIVSSVIAAFCACLGGLCSLVYTDTFQLWTAFVGLWLCVPFCLNSRTASSLKPNLNLQDREMFPPLPETVDRFLSLAYGGIPWQVPNKKAPNG